MSKAKRDCWVGQCRPELCQKRTVISEMDDCHLCDDHVNSTLATPSVSRSKAQVLPAVTPSILHKGFGTSSKIPRFAHAMPKANPTPPSLPLRGAFWHARERAGTVSQLSPRVRNFERHPPSPGTSGHPQSRRTGEPPSARDRQSAGMQGARITTRSLPDH